MLKPISYKTDIIVNTIKQVTANHMNDEIENLRNSLLIEIIFPNNDIMKDRNDVCTIVI